MAHSGKYRALRYKTRPQKQKRVFQGKLIGCTETSFAMGAMDTTQDGVRLTETIVRKLSGEEPPDPASPGLNQGQLVKVAEKLHIPYVDGSGHTFEWMLDKLQEERCIVAQLWYADIGGGNIGHAIILEAYRVRTGGNILGVDPITGKRRWFETPDIKRGMERFGQMTGVANGGVRFGYFKVCKFVAAGAS